MSGVAVARAMNITPQYYYELEKGKKRLNEDLLKKLAEIFECTIDHLLGFSSTPRPAVPAPPEKVGDPSAAFLHSGDGYPPPEELERIICQAVKRALEEWEKERRADGRPLPPGQ